MNWRNKGGYAFELHTLKVLGLARRYGSYQIRYINSTWVESWAPITNGLYQQGRLCLGLMLASVETV